MVLGVSSSSEWQNSVKTINSTNEPNSPISGDRYLIGAHGGPLI
jgi:hypothetical protein